MGNRQALIIVFLSFSCFLGSGLAEAAASQWKLIGPQPLIYTDGTQDSGLVNALAMDPRNSSVVYLGAGGGGVWKTTDGGLAWVPLTDDQPSLQIGALALDPSNSDVVYVGTSVSNAIFGNRGAGILTSTDGGASWAQLAGPVPYGPASRSSFGHWRLVPPTAMFCSPSASRLPASRSW